MPNFVALLCVKGGYRQGGLYTRLFMNRQVEITFMDKGLINVWDVSLVSDFVT